MLITFFKLIRLRNADAVSKYLSILNNFLVSNGPGVAIPVYFTFFIYRLMLLSWSPKMVFIESFCRVKDLSLTGKILYKSRFMNK